MQKLFTLLQLGITAGIVLMGTTQTGLAQESAIRACLTPGVGQLRVLGTGESCRANETPLNWTSGSGSESYTKVTPPDTLVSPSNPNTPILSLTVPEGSYVVQVTFFIYNQGGGAVACRISGDTKTYAFYGGYNVFESTTLHAAVSTDGTGQLGFYCTVGAGFTGRITATRTNLTVQ